jgi:hypothetical protein
VQGNIYSLITSTTAAPFLPSPFPPPPGTDLWLGVSSYVKQLLQSSMPDFVASQPVEITPPNPAPAANSFTVTAPARTIPSKSERDERCGGVGGTQRHPVQCGCNVRCFRGVFINNVTGSPGAGQCTVPVTYTVTGVPATLATPILSFNVTATAVCPVGVEHEAARRTSKHTGCPRPTWRVLAEILPYARTARAASYNYLGINLARVSIRKGGLSRMFLAIDVLNTGRFQLVRIKFDLLPGAFHTALGVEFLDENRSYRRAHAEYR